MNEKNDKEIIIDLVKKNLQINFSCDEELFLKLWHPNAHRFGLGNSNELYSFNRSEINEHMRQLAIVKKKNPALASTKIVFDEIDNIIIYQNLIASVAVKWHMEMPDSKGTHYSFIHLAKNGESWQIVNVLDRGFEHKEE